MLGHRASSSRHGRGKRLAAATALVLGLVGATALPAGAGTPCTPTTGFTCQLLADDLDGAAFAHPVDLIDTGDGVQEIVAAVFGPLVAGTPSGGTLATFRKVGATWQRSDVFTSDTTIPFPNDPTFADIDGDGDLDVVVPGGFFISAIAAQPASGSLQWFEQVPGAAGAAPTWLRHQVVPSAHPAFFHRAEVVDLDGDGRLDLVTVAETAASATVQVYAGTATAARFSTVPTVLSIGGGSLPVVEDVDGDGDLDIASAQYFDRTASFVWFERVAAVPAPFGTWVRHIMATGLGGSIQLSKVPGLGWVGTNHTNTTSGPPGTPTSAVFRLRPGTDPTLPWTIEPISTGIVSGPDQAAGNQQGAPGVFGWGDLDGDGDTDIGVSGDGDDRGYWLRNDGPVGAERFTTIVVDPILGQAGGGDIADVDGDGVAELVLSSYEQDRLAFYRLAAATPTAAVPETGAPAAAVAVALTGAAVALLRRRRAR